MVVDSAKDVNGQRYAPRRAKEYEEEKLFQYKVPELSVQDLLSAIPAHCYKRSTFYSSLYLIGDLVQAGLLIYAATWIDPVVSQMGVQLPSLSPDASKAVMSFALWALYGFVQGLVFTGVWVVAHECGHQAFSPSKTVNNAVGWVLHSALLVPYHSWRISHARHHAGTGHMTRDEVFVPKTRSSRGLLPLRPADDKSPLVNENTTWGEWIAEILEDAPLYNFIELLIQQLLGWPLYLLFNVSGQPHYPPYTNHFSPNSIIFDKRHRNQILASDAGILLTLSCLYAWAKVAPGGWMDVAKYYIVPYLWTNHWLVMITYLQHTDVKLPHYQPSMWTFPRGALCTIDREWLGLVGPWFFHGISETHVAHHVSSKIPHYNAWEATEALKKRLGPHYLKSTENVFVTLWKTVRSCRFVDDEPVAFYRNADGVPGSVPVFPRNADSGVALSE
ncbi:delta-12 fatty acid desaturase [Malassezia pachydermatis]|uniref:Delta-12 fatty acid desaturase n=1 Tax=Malassezia pachydermatis TaxID=77020 RepID=A0A0M9VQV5_9BASI|nr:delta-12 fatty acid desaturase [Malassezia pachydermatis]KOS15782.1 delta-12 fatty acid desaturase [Malassezia pachydermatis]